MPGSDAKRGDVYRVKREATVDANDVRTEHPMVCVAEQPADPVAWKGMARITTGARPGDLPSPQDQGLPFTKDGYWTLRFLHPVKKACTGHPELCCFMIALPEPVKSEVLGYYMKRTRDQRA